MMQELKVDEEEEHDEQWGKVLKAIKRKDKKLDMLFGQAKTTPVQKTTTNITKQQTDTSIL